MTALLSMQIGARSAMAEKEVFIGSVGPFIYEENDFYAFQTDGKAYVGETPTAPNEVLRHQDAILMSGDQTVDGKKTFDGEVELNNDLNHDGTNVGFYGAEPVPQASAIPTITGEPGASSEVGIAVNAILVALRNIGIIAT